MKIIIQEKEKDKCHTVRIPLKIALNPATAAVAAANSDLTFEQMNALMKAFRQSAKLLNGQPFVEVTGQDGDRVIIYL